MRGGGNPGVYSRAVTPTSIKRLCPIRLREDKHIADRNVSAYEFPGLSEWKDLYEIERSPSVARARPIIVLRRETPRTCKCRLGSACGGGRREPACSPDTRYASAADRTFSHGPVPWVGDRLNVGPPLPPGPPRQDEAEPGGKPAGALLLHMPKSPEHPVEQRVCGNSKGSRPTHTGCRLGRSFCVSGIWHSVGTRISQGKSSRTLQRPSRPPRQGQASRRLTTRVGARLWPLLRTNPVLHRSTPEVAYQRHWSSKA